MQRILSFALRGIDALPVEIECDETQSDGGATASGPDERSSSPGMPIIGLPDASVRESTHRVRAALRNGDEGSRARLASAAAASRALAHSGASQSNQSIPASSGSSSRAAAIAPTRSISMRRAKGRSSSAQPTPTAVAVITRA